MKNAIWPGFVDAMTGLLLVLMFVLTIFMVIQFVLRETITGQESKLNALSSEIATLAAALGLEQNRNTTLSANLDEANATARTQAALIDSLTAERDAGAAALVAAQNQITGFEAQVAGLLAERRDLQTANATLTAQNAQAISEAEALNLALATARSEIDAGAEAARLAAARREALEALVADLQGQATAGTERISQLEEQALVDAAAAQALRDRLQNSDAELTAMSLALEEQRRKAEETLTLLAAADAVRDTLDSDLAAALLAVQTAERERAALAESQTETEADRQAIADQLAQALAAIAASKDAETVAMTEQERQAALLATANAALREQEAISAEGLRQVAALNAQVAELRNQVGTLQSLLDLAENADVEAKVQIESLGSQLNTALARVAAEERRRLALEQAERARLEEEAARLAAEAQNLERFRSDFFGEMRQILEGQDGVRIEGDRFVFSSEVLFQVGQAELSDQGRAEIANVAGLLRRIAVDIPANIDWVIRVDGHTDNVPLSGLGEFRDNWELSQARALSVVRYMADTLGIPPNRLAANGFGEFQPINPADTPEARAQNRRIELKLTER